MANFFSFFFFFFFVSFYFVQAEICVEHEAVYPIVDGLVGSGVRYHDRTPWGKNILLSRFGVHKPLGYNTDYSNRDIGLYKSWYPRSVHSHNYDLPIYGSGVYRTSLGRGIVDNEQIYNRNLVHPRNYPLHNIYDYSNDVGDYVKTDIGLDMDINVVGKDNIDRSYRIDFFKGNYGVIKSRSECDCVCPNTIPRGDLTNELVFDIVQKDVINKLWNNRRMPHLSILGKRMKYAILNLANSEVAIYKKFSFIFSSFFLGQYQNVDVNSICPFIKIVDLSVMYSRTHDVSLLKQLNELIALITKETIKVNALSAIYTSGCHAGINIERFALLEDHVQCLDESHVLNHVVDLWAREGSLLPETIRSLVHDLWRSSYYPDRLMAVIATMILTPEVNTFVEDWNMYQWFESTNMLATEIVPECCCSFRVNRLHEILSIAKQEIIRNVERVEHSGIREIY